MLENAGYRSNIVQWYNVRRIAKMRQYANSKTLQPYN